MKTIEVSDEMYDQLIKLSKEMNSQSNRATAMPYFFQIQTKEIVPTAEGCGTEAWNFDGTRIESEDEIINAIFEFNEGKISKEEIKEMSDYTKESIMEESGWRKVWYDHEYKYQNAFLTEKACKEHIRKNNYHYSEPVDYLNHAFRNPEMELVIKFLCELTGGSVNK